MSDHVGPRKRRKYEIMCKDQFGNNLKMSFALTQRNDAVAAKRDTGLALVMMGPRVVREMIECLRDLEAQMYEHGWPDA